MTLEVGKKDNLKISRSGTSYEIKDDLFGLKSVDDESKEVDFDLSGITTATKRTITVPDRDVTIGEMSDDPSPQFGTDVDGQGFYAIDLQNFSDGLSGKGAKYWLDGVDDAISIADSANLDFDADDNFYILMAIKPNDVTRATDYLINKEAGGIGWGLYLNEDDLYIRIDDGTTDASAIIGTAVFSNDVEAVILIVCDRSGNATAYVNGILVGTVDVSGVTLTIENAGALHIGNDSAGGNEFYGEIQLCNVGNKTLSTSEIKAFSNGASLPYKYAGASQAELMPNQVDRDFSGASAWANVDLNAFDETDDLTITATAADQYCTLVAASAPTTIGKRYRMSFDVANIVSTWTIQSFDGTQTIGTVSANGTGTLLEWTATTVGGYRIVAVADDSSADFDNFTLTQLGCVLDLNQSGVGHNTWEDISGNGLHGVVSGALPINRSANHSEKYIDLLVTDDTSFTLPAGYIIDSIVLESDGAIGGGIDVGTTDGGGEIVTAETVAGAGKVLCTLVAGANYNLTGADDTIYITDADATGWDSATVAFTVKMSRIEI